MHFVLYILVLIKAVVNTILHMDFFFQFLIWTPGFLNNNQVHDNRYQVTSKLDIIKINNIQNKTSKLQHQQ